METERMLIECVACQIKWNEAYHKDKLKKTICKACLMEMESRRLKDENF